MSILKYAVRRTFLFSFLKSIKDNRQVSAWEKSGRPVPPPYIVKRRIIKDFAQQYKTKVFVETGTAAGDTTAVMIPIFNKIYSIEINTKYYEQAKKRFSGISKIELVNGDSGKVLSDLITNKIKEPVLFWLDGHYNSVKDIHGNEEVCPIYKELECIFNHQIKNHVILIDDARLFLGSNGYPTIDEVKSWVKSKRPDLLFSIETDIIRILPG